MTTASKNAQSTAIGSLPHHNVDVALAYSFQFDIPFLPQIPIRNPWEFMIAQALDGLPGLLVEKDGQVSLDADVWLGRSHAFSERLRAAFEGALRPDAFEAFEPSSATSSCWQPFLWELEERQVKLAKIQLAGPLTCQWSLRLRDGRPADQEPELCSQIFKLVLARALAMSRRLISNGIQPILYLDEPGLYGLSLENPRHVLGLQELKLVVQTLKKEKVRVGIHCCSDTDWAAVLALEPAYLSLDTGLSLESLLQRKSELAKFISDGGRLSLGVIPTMRESQSLHFLNLKTLFNSLVGSLSQAYPDQPELVRKILGQALYTPACGLALHTPADAEVVLSTLLDFTRLCQDTLAGSTGVTSGK